MKPNTHRHRLPVSGKLGFAGFSACVKSHESAAFLESTGPIFQVPLNPTYVVKSVLCRDLSVCGTSTLSLEETFSMRVMVNRTHVIYTNVSSIFELYYNIKAESSLGLPAFFAVSKLLGAISAKALLVFFEKTQDCV